MRRKSLRELYSLINNEIKYLEEYEEYFSNNDNPQVLKMKLQNETRIEALKDVLLYIENGEKYPFIHLDTHE